MSDQERGDTEHLDAVERVLLDVSAPTRTRRGILEGAAIGVAAAAGVGLVDPAQEVFADPGISNRVLTRFGRNAANTERLAITYFTEVLRRAENGVATPPAKLSTAESITELRAVNRSESLHLKFLEKEGFEASVERFWLPDIAFGPLAVAEDDSVDLQTTFLIDELAEEITANLYLIGITGFAKLSKARLARQTAEILAIEYQHRGVARAAQGKLPGSNHGFVTYENQRESKIEGEFEAFGIGYDEKGMEPGAFYDFEGTNGREIPLENEEPDPEGSLMGAFPPDEDD